MLPASLSADILWNSGSCSHFHIRRNVSRPDFNLLHGLGFLKRSLSVPWLRQSTLWAKTACGMLYRFNSLLILCASSFVLISSTSCDLLLWESAGPRERSRCGLPMWLCGDVSGVTVVFTCRLFSDDIMGFGECNRAGGARERYVST